MAYLPLSTANLPSPVIDPATGATPDQHFNTVLYTGDGTNSNAVTGVGFQPDFIWGKSRSAARSHGLVDAVRGTGLLLFSDLTNADNSANNVMSFDTDGFTVGNDNTLNASGESYVAWNWKANGSGVSNNVGTIPSTVSANTTSGFSIVSYTGNATSGATIGHGLDSAPEMVIVKSRTSGSTGWYVYHQNVGNTKALILNGTIAADTFSGYWNNTTPSSTVFTLGNGTDTNANSGNFIAYCFHSVEGFSKFGSYTGNGSADGPFVYTGFRPSWIMIKSSSNASTPWQIFDATRETFNTVEQSLIANGANAEPYDTASPVDFLSNGFKLRGGASSWNNYNTGTWIYACFSEQPFKYSNAR